MSGPSNGCSGSCHGEGDSIAPPRDTSGRTDLTSIGVGAHQAHLASSDWHKRFACETCHKVPQEVGDLGHILVAGANGALEKDPLPAELSPTGLGVGLSWDHDTATCTNSYCHGDTLHQVDPANNMIVPGTGGTITKPIWTQMDGTQKACGACHGNPPPAPHPQQSDCGLCHQSMNPGDFAKGKISYPELHIDGLVEVASTQPCDSCHGSGGQSAPPRDAHNHVATTAPGVGAHAQHMTTSASSWHAPIGCNECHQVPGSTTDQTHLDSINEVFMDPTIAIPGSPTGTGGHLQIPGAAYNPTTFTCSGTYCHGGGGSPLLGGTKTTPLWTKVDGSQSTCQSCHGTPPPAPHPQGAAIANCGTCHPTMIPGANTTIAYPALHINGTVEVVNDQPCNNCHGDKNGTPVAGDNKINAPPTDTTGGTSTNLRSVGAHQSHLMSSTWRAPIACGACHKVPASLESIGHIDSPLPAEVIFGPIAGTTATWNTTTCSNVYCHGATLKQPNGSSAGGTTTKPVWTVVDGSQSQCTSCHGNPPPAPHIQGAAAADCGTCHNTMTAGQPGVITDPTRHINGSVDVNTDQPCNFCHGSAGTPTMNGAPINAPPKDTSGNMATNTRGVGAHQAHLAPTSPIGKLVVCADCHMIPGADSAVGHIDTPLPAEVLFSSRAGSSPQWNGALCSNTYCHGATLTQSNGSGAGGTKTSPNWTLLDGTQKACTACHGNPPPAPHIQGAAATDCGTCHDDVKVGTPTQFVDVTRHIDGNVDVSGSTACNGCHGDHGTAPASNSDPKNAPPFDSSKTGSATSLRGVGAHTKHLATGSPFHANIACGTCHIVPAALGSVGHIDTPLPAEVTFTGLAVGSTWNGTTCSSYCHGTTLTESNGAGAGGTATNPLWTKTDGSQGTCASCHGNPPPAPHPQGGTVSNCGTCHADVMVGSPTVFTNVNQHINGTVEVTAGSNHPSGYQMVTMHGYDVDKNGLASCATSGCHGTTLTGGTTGGPSCTTVTGCHDKVGTGYTWQTQCTFCHGVITTPSGNGAPPDGVLGATAATDPTVGAHAKHVGATTMHAAWDCGTCHIKPTNATSTGHIDGTGGIVQAEVKFSALNPSSVFNFTTNTCTNNYCHGTAVTTATSPAWTSTTALTCLSCHGGDPSRTGMSSNHRRSDHKVQCAKCHSTVVNATPAIINPALHVDGIMTVVFNPGTWNAANRSCTGTGNGCHGNGTKSGW